MAAQVIYGRERPGAAKATFENWGLFRSAEGSVVLSGVIDGTPWRSSEITAIDSRGRWVKTANSVYDLGRPDPAAAARALAAVDGPNHGRQAVPLPPPPVSPGDLELPAGFQTARGSVYRIGADGRTTRLKKSLGQGHDEVHEPMMALYVAREHAAQLLPLMPAIESLKVGAWDPRTQAFQEFEHAIAVPEGWKPTVAVFDRQTGQYLRGCLAELTPRVGLSPVEKRYDWEPNGDRNGTTHIGNAIARLLDAAALEQAWRAAGGPPTRESFADRLGRMRRDRPEAEAAPAPAASGAAR